MHDYYCFFAFAHILSHCFTVCCTNKRLSGSAVFQQFLYHAWITDPKTALREKSKERRKFWKKYTKGVRSRKSKKASRFQNQNKVDGLFDSSGLRVDCNTYILCSVCMFEGHVTIEVGDLPDGVAGDENGKKSEGPGLLVSLCHNNCSHGDNNICLFT